MPVVMFYATLRQLTGEKKKIVPGANLREILATLEQEFPGLQAFHGEAGRFRTTIVVNGTIINPEIAMDIPVSEADRIDIFPPIAGG